MASEHVHRLRQALNGTVTSLHVKPVDVVEKDTDAFTAELKVVKTELRALGVATKPRFLHPAGPGIDAIGPPPPLEHPCQRRAEHASLQLKSQLRALHKRPREESTLSSFVSLVVKPVQDGRVVMVKDKAGAFLCVIRLDARKQSVQDVFFLRGDEDAGKMYGMRQSQYSYWKVKTRQMQESVANGEVSDTLQVLRWIEEHIDGLSV